MAKVINLKFGVEIHFRKYLKITKLGQNGSDLDDFTYFSNLWKFLNIIEMATAIHFKFGNEIKLREHDGKM